MGSDLTQLFDMEAVTPLPLRPSRELVREWLPHEFTGTGPRCTARVERAARQAQLQQAESDFVPLAFDEAAARAFGRVAADLRASGRKQTARAFDALIAATAIANGRALYTTNPSDFEAISGLELRTVPHPDAAVSATQPA